MSILTDLIKQDERVDDLQCNDLKIIQHPSKFCFGMDAVLLSNFATAKDGDKVLDLCTGTGIVPILMTAKTNASHFTGLEIQAESAEMASRSVRLNGLEERMDIVCGDVKDTVSIFGAASMDVVTVNPPYMTEHHGITNPEDAMAIARHEIKCSLEDVISQSAKVLKPGGKFYMVHRPFRLSEIFEVMNKYKLEPKRMRLVYPFVDKEPNMVLIEGVRGGKKRITVEKPLIVYKEQGVYSDEIYEIYGMTRDGKA